MSRDEGGRWLPIHTGLLDDQRFLASGRAREAWLVLYLALDRERSTGWFTDEARVKFILERSNVTRPDVAIATLRKLDWLVPEHDDSPRLTIRGWHNYTGRTARQAIYNRDRGDRTEEYRRRPTTRAARGVTEGDGAVTDSDGRLEERRRDENIDALARGGEMVDFDTAMKGAGIAQHIRGRKDGVV